MTSRPLASMPSVRLQRLPERQKKLVTCGWTIRGFSLVEMALVLLILGVLTRAAIVPIAAARQHRQEREVVEQLQTIRQAIWGHVVARGSLPCPLMMQTGQAAGTATPGNADLAVSSSSSSSSPAEREPCRTEHGLVPAQVLGLAGAIDSRGALLDPWYRPYRLTVSLGDHDLLGTVGQPDWTTAGEASRVGIASMEAQIVLCLRASRGPCPSRSTRANQLSFVVLSTGVDASTHGAQEENIDSDSVFVQQEYSIDPSSPFDDHLVWGTAADTLYWMLRSGWLP